MTALDRGQRSGPLTRRRFLQLSAIATSGLALSVACGQPPAPAKPAESAKPAEAAKPAAAAPTAVPTIAAAVVPQAQATAAAPATQAPAAAKPAAAAGPSGQVTVIQQLPITTLDANMEQSLANLNPSIHMADPLIFREPNGSVTR
jgi:hypothetical protein